MLAHPLTKCLSPDDPRTTELRRDIVRGKSLLNKIYSEWYERIIQTLPDGPGHVLELGSGGGFFKEKFPACICSEVFHCSGIDCVLDGQALPFKDSSLKAIVMVDVLHHIPDPARFFTEAERALRSGGVITMIEPWNTAWSRLIYQHFHPEPFLPDTPTWQLPAGGPLSAANGALPWILFHRDHQRFQRQFPCLRLENITLDYPFIYLASGGVSLRSLSPGWSFSVWRGLEKILSPFMSHLAMFALIAIQRATSTRYDGSLLSPENESLSDSLK